MGFSRITAGLYQGSKPPRRVAGFDVVVLCAAECQHAVEGPELVIRLPLWDDFELPLTAKAQEDAVALAGVLKKIVQAGGRVLVTCHLGYNRSGLVSALTLMRMGYGAGDAIHLVRKARGVYALSNPQFVRFIESLGTPERRAANG